MFSPYRAVNTIRLGYKNLCANWSHFTILFTYKFYNNILQHFTIFYNNILHFTIFYNYIFYSYNILQYFTTIFYILQYFTTIYFTRTIFHNILKQYFFWLLTYIVGSDFYLIYEVPHSKFLAQQPPQWARAFLFTRFLDHTQRRTTVGKTSLEEWSARRRDVYLRMHAGSHLNLGIIWSKWIQSWWTFPNTQPPDWHCEAFWVRTGSGSH
jgi:hypothetical protein